MVLNARLKMVELLSRMSTHGFAGVRSSLPKRVWNKCMEYKVNVGQGKVVWYKLKNGNDVPVMVSHLFFFH